MMFFGHEVNENVAQKRAASPPTARRLIRGSASWGKPKKPIRVALGTLVTESAHKVIVVEK
jgi:hypothetical protein